jgi:uncharacterized protein
MYDNGERLQEERAEPAQWYRRAADQRLAEAQTKLGILYDSGEGVQEDDTEAARRFRKAADKGDF